MSEVKSPFFWLSTEDALLIIGRNRCNIETVHMIMC